MGKSLTWRELLGEIIENPTERQRLAAILGVNSITLTRWASGVSDPRRNAFRRLLDALPEYRKQLSDLMAQEYTDFFIDISEETHRDTSLFVIPSSFYSHILNTYAMTSPFLRTPILLNLIVKQIISQFDADNSSGIKVIIAQFVAPDEKDRSVQSLRRIAGGITPPWTDFQTMFLGAESQIGLAILSNHMITMEDFSQEPQALLFPEKTIEMSSVACPILSAKGVAGCFSISSIQPNYFTPARLALVQHYADLLILAFDPNDFYPNESIRLGIMPTYQQQESYIRSFEVRVRETLLQAAQKQQFMTRPMAERIVWKKLEQKLLTITSSLPAIEQR